MAKTAFSWAEKGKKKDKQEERMFEGANFFLWALIAYVQVLIRLLRKPS